ncbi:hypothetical protein HKCCSP123_11515 [Rhodobacterales bacterium HKCCSP123]|nr:hypothetical protein [Rhodobacterales bacterium HKCCSP123]
MGALSKTDPARFGLASFADVLPPRGRIVGEDPSDFTAFREALIQDLAPATAYEAVLAENLVRMEWDLLQHRSMRDAGVRRSIRDRIKDAVVAEAKAAYGSEMNEAKQRYIEEGGYGFNFERPYDFDEAAAEEVGADLAMRAVSEDAGTRSEAYEEIARLGLLPVDLMADAYSSAGRAVAYHEEQIRDLERRCAGQRREFDALVSKRPIDVDGAGS